MSEALINPQILQWARERAGLTEEELAKKINIKKSDKIVLWEKGEALPTFLQAQKLAKTLHIPFGYFYLDKVPQEKFPIPDLRTVGDRQYHEFSLEVYDLIREIQLKQDWYRDYLLEQGAEPLEFAGKYSLRTSIATITEDITHKLGLTIEHRKNSRNWEEFLRLLINKSEAIGIWVMRSGIVGNNTHRSLDVQEFRGFAIFDNIAPIIFINGKDAKAAQIFTLIHELVHIWIAESGISDLSLETPAQDVHGRIEKLCNAVAAEVLVPQNILRSKWNNKEDINELAAFFRVSGVVIARRAVDLGLMTWKDFSEFYAIEKRRWTRMEQSKGSGSQPKYTLPLRYGQHFTETLLRAAINGHVMLRDAGRFLGTKPSKLFKLAKDMGVA